jgi:hypothetical protein
MSSHRRRRRQAVAAGAIVIGSGIAGGLVLWLTGLLDLLAEVGVDALLLAELVAVVTLIGAVWTAMLLWTLDLLEQARRGLADEAELDVVLAEARADIERARRRAEREHDRDRHRRRVLRAVPYTEQAAAELGRPGPVVFAGPRRLAPADPPYRLPGEGESGLDDTFDRLKPPAGLDPPPSA